MKTVLCCDFVKAVTDAQSGLGYANEIRKAAKVADDFPLNGCQIVYGTEENPTR